MRALLAVLALAGCRQIFGLHELKQRDAAGDSGGLPDAAYKDAPYPDTPPGFWRIGGTVSGLTASGLVLQNNGGDDLPRMADGPFQFMTAIGDGAAYAVTVSAQPSGETCSVANSSGHVSGADVTSVMVTCSSNGSAVRCDTQMCTIGGAMPICCDLGANTFACESTCMGGGFLCDSASDCSTAGDVCCGTIVGGTVRRSDCSAAGSCVSGLYFCDPNAATPCPTGFSCAANQVPGAPPSYFQCQ